MNNIFTIISRLYYFQSYDNYIDSMHTIIIISNFLYTSVLRKPVIAQTNACVLTSESVYNFSGFW